MNYCGEHWFEVIRLIGKSHKRRPPANPHLFSILTSRGSRLDDYYLSDLGVTTCKTSSKKLFPFSHKLLLKLKQLSADKRAFLEFLTEHKMSDEDWRHISARWALEKELDKMMYADH